MSTIAPSAYPAPTWIARVKAYPRASSAACTKAVPRGVPEAAYDSQIYHSSDDWDWLSAPGKIVPGGKYVNTRSGMACSTG